MAKWTELTVGVFTSRCYLTVDILASVLPVIKQKESSLIPTLRLEKPAGVSVVRSSSGQHFIAIHYWRYAIVCSWRSEVILPAGPTATSFHYVHCVHSFSLGHWTVQSSCLHFLGCRWALLVNMWASARLFMAEILTLLVVSPGSSAYLWKTKVGWGWGGGEEVVQSLAKPRARK